MKDVIIIDHEPYTIRRENIFRIKELQHAGINVQFWDCSQIFHKGIIIVDEVNALNVKKILTLSELESLIKSIDITTSVFIVEVFNCYSNRRFFRLLSRYNCFWIKINLYSSSVLGKTPFVQRLCMATLKTILKSVCFRGLFMAHRIYNKVYRVSPPRLYISSGNDKSIDYHINHPDWDLFQEKQEKVTLIDKKYAVFIDEYFPLHPDLMFFISEKKHYDSQHYLQVITDFFSMIEGKFNLSVIIAAHPKSAYDSEDFGGRRVIKYETIELVRSAELVIMHASAAVSFAILYNKPIGIIATNDYMSMYSQRMNIERLASYIQTPYYNIEKEVGDFIPHLIPEAIREKYKYEYLTTKETENLVTSQILINILCNI